MQVNYLNKFVMMVGKSYEGAYRISARTEMYMYTDNLQLAYKILNST